MGNYRGFKTNFRVRTAYARKVVSRKLVDIATVPVDATNVQFKKSIAGICSYRPLRHSLRALRLRAFDRKDR